MSRDRHAEYEWQQQALQGRRSPTIAPAPRRPNRYRAPPRTSGLRRVLAILALSLVAAGALLVLHTGVGCHP